MTTDHLLRRNALLLAKFEARRAEWDRIQGAIHEAIAASPAHERDDAIAVQARIAPRPAEFGLADAPSVDMVRIGIELWQRASKRAPVTPRDVKRKAEQRAVRFRSGRRLQKHTHPKPAVPDDHGK